MRNEPEEWVPVRCTPFSPLLSFLVILGRRSRMSSPRLWYGMGVCAEPTPEPQKHLHWNCDIVTTTQFADTPINRQGLGAYAKGPQGYVSFLGGCCFTQRKPVVIL